ncbi:hypothetical protein GOODEAATRI_016400, partial [Goodea atripinnis]
EVIEAQEKTITSLLIAVKEQHDQLDHQKIKIKNLEEKVAVGYKAIWTHIAPQKHEADKLSNEG